MLTPDGRRRPVLVFLHRRLHCIDPDIESYHWLAAEVGFETWVLRADSVAVDAGALIASQGYRVDSRQARRWIDAPESIRPDIVIPRKTVYARDKALLDAVRANVPGVLLGWDPVERWIDDKALVEDVLRAGAEHGVLVPRPVTFLIRDERDVDELRWLGMCSNLVLKAADIDEGRAVRFTSPGDFAWVAAEMLRRWGAPLVAQRVITRPLLLQERKADLRLFVLVFSADPERIVMPPEGVVRIALEPYDEQRVTDPDVALTNYSHAIRRRRRPLTMPLSVALQWWSHQGHDVGTLLDQARALVRDVVWCWQRAVRSRISGEFVSLLGIDLLPLNGGAGPVTLQFIECNTFPGITEWASADTDSAVQSAHREWLTALFGHRRESPDEFSFA